MYSHRLEANRQVGLQEVRRKREEEAQGSKEPLRKRE
jgi:hypothetical protein